METPTTHEGLEEYAKSLDLSPTEVLALLEGALSDDSAPQPDA
jgi:hypothetical protein